MNNHNSSDCAHPSYVSAKNLYSEIGYDNQALIKEIVGYDGGHMDLIESTTSDFLCHSHCYFKCKEVWFWGLS